MSWIFGVWDPNGVDPDLVLKAAEPSLPKLTPHIEVLRNREAVFGALAFNDEPGVIRSGDDLIAADARVDAVGDTDQGSVEGASAAAALLDTLRARGIEGLDDLAADFSLAWLDQETGQLLLARDATANRPLYWGLRGTCMAFASHPSFLIGLGICDGEIEPETCARYLAGVTIDSRQTGLRGIYRVLGGRWLRASEPNNMRGGRWFRPERDPVDREVTDDSIAGVKEAIGLSVRDRARAGQVGVWLSGGRDSGTIALALAQQGVTADCYTMTFEKGICESEDGPARALAESAGHRWTGVLQSISVDSEDLRRLLQRSLQPLGYPFATSGRANHRVAVDRGSRILMEGYGGELFVASPLATWDLALSLRIGDALRSARAFNDRWVHGYEAQLKGAARAIAPRRALEIRERSRTLPPWSLHGIKGALDPHTVARSAREGRLRFLLWEGTNPGREKDDAASFPDGVRTTYPFYDRRVIRAALRFPAVSLVPDPEPKWILRQAFLGSWADSRVKASHEEWFRALARGAWESHPLVFDKGGRLARAGLVEPDGVQPPFGRNWEIQSSALVWTDTAVGGLAHIYLGRGSHCS